MTEEADGIAQAAAAINAGQTAAASVQAAGEALLQIPGGGEDVGETERSADDQAVSGIGTSVEPSAVSPQPASSPNTSVSQSGHP